MKLSGRRKSSNVTDLRKTSKRDTEIIARSGDKLFSKKQMKDEKGGILDSLYNKMGNPGRQKARGPSKAVSKPTKFVARKSSRIKKNG